MNEKTSKDAASAAARVLRDPNASDDAKSAAGSALTQREPERVADSEHAAFEAWIDQHPLGYPGIEYDAFVAGYRAALQSQDRDDALRYRYLITKLQQVYDGDYFETDLMSLYCHMPSQYKGERVVRAEITWRDKADEPIGLSEAIDHARRVEGDGNG